MPKAPLPRIVDASFFAGAQNAGSLPAPTGVEVAFAGRSNVGKSSLLNSLMSRRNLVRTSSTPGCTRQISFYHARLAQGAHMQLVDLPGYGYAKRSKTERKSWAELIDGYLLRRPTLAAVALLFDARRGVEEEELALLELMASPAEVSRRDVPVILIATKLDKLPRSKRKALMSKVRAIAPGPVLGYSIHEDECRGELLQLLCKTLDLGAVTTESPDAEPVASEPVTNENEADADAPPPASGA